MSVSSISSDDEDVDSLSGFRDEEEVEKETSKKKECCKAFLRFLFSWVGLAILLALYTVLGAFYFYECERPLEEHRETIAKNAAEDIKDAMTYIVERMTYISYGDLTGNGKFNNCTVWIQDDFYVSDQGDYGDACLDKTSEAVQNSDFCKCLWNYKERYEMEASQNLYRLAAYLVSSVDETGYAQDEDTNEFTFQKKWTFLNALLFTMTTLTLIGYGQISPTTDALKMQVVVYTIVGIPIMALFLANIGSLFSKVLTYIYSRICCRWCRIRRKVSEEKEPLTLKDDVVGEEEYMPTDQVLVPIVLALILMGAYVMIGAFIYVQWEGWSIMDAAYFTFVTLTTIGFGDLVPGSVKHESTTSLYGKLIFTTLYCLFGLALIALGIDIMQDHAKAKAKLLQDDDDGMTVYIMTTYPDARETPAGKTGNKTRFGDDSSDDDEDDVKFDEVAEIKEVESLEEEDAVEEEEGQQDEEEQEKEEGGGEEEQQQEDTGKEH